MSLLRGIVRGIDRGIGARDVVQDTGGAGDQFIHGQEVTLTTADTGVSFGTKSLTNVQYEDFENKSVGGDYTSVYGSETTIPNPADGVAWEVAVYPEFGADSATISSSSPRHSNKTRFFRMITSGDYLAYVRQYLSLGVGSKAYASHWARNALSAGCNTSDNLKYMEWYYNSFVSSFYVSSTPDGLQSDFFLSGGDHTGSSINGTHVNSCSSLGSWVRVENEMTVGSVYRSWVHDQGEPYVELLWTIDPSNTTITAIGAGAPYTNHQSGNCQSDVDDLYLDWGANSWSRIEIADTNSNPFNQDYTGNRELQRPTSWANDSVSIIVNQGAFSSLVNKYVWLRTASGGVTLVGQIGSDLRLS